MVYIPIFSRLVYIIRNNKDSLTRKCYFRKKEIIISSKKKMVGIVVKFKPRK